MSINDKFFMIIYQQKKMYQNKGRFDDERHAKGTKQFQAFDQLMMSENPKPDLNFGFVKLKI
jgi:hypothetical protein